jgi:nicotinate-nucleotide adenylyltransferase
LSAKPARIGMYGGAFDPPHNAHSTLARCAVQQFGLQMLHIFPTGQAWHKSRVMSDAQHRLAMTRLAFADLPNTQVDVRETQRTGATYTIDTLLELRAENPAAQLFVVMGEDQLEAFDGWHRYTEIMQIATLLIAGRARIHSAKSTFSIQNPLKIAYQRIEMPLLTISATDIRTRAAQGQPIDHLVNPAVARYIATHHLYQST